MQNQVWLIVDTKKVGIAALVLSIGWFFWPSIVHYKEVAEYEIKQLQAQANVSTGEKAKSKLAFWR